MSKPSILLATPCFGGWVSQNYMLSVIGLMSYAKSAGFEVSLSMVGDDALIARARSTLVGYLPGQPGDQSSAVRRRRYRFRAAAGGTAPEIR